MAKMAGASVQDESAPVSSARLRQDSRMKAAVRCDSSEQRMARLVRTIETEIIPRLVLARRTSGEDILPPRDASSIASAISAEQVAEFARLVLEHEALFADAYVQALRAQGTQLDRIFLDLLAPTARHLGDLWEADLLDFAEVTVGLCRLHGVLQHLSPSFSEEVEQIEPGRRVMLATVAGENHTFGVFMVAEFFRRAGWDVLCAPPASNDEILGRVHRSWFAVVGLSVSCDTHLDTVATLVRGLRRASLNRDVGIMVGGPIFSHNPSFVTRVGADATASDARQAPIQAERLLSLLAKV